MQAESTRLLSPEGMDRNSLAWTGAQLDMIDELSTYGKPMIVLQMGGGQLDGTPIISNDNISALIWGGYPGQDGGKALVDTITGKNAPAGRLPTTQYPADYISLVPMTDMSLRPNATSGSPGRTYQWYTGKPIFEYGFGMHYTAFSASILSLGSTFAISDLMSNCTGKEKDQCSFATVKVKITNTGSVTSDYSTLGFLAGQHGPTPYPNKRLAAYTRLHGIAGGSSATASLKMTLGSLGRVDEMGNTWLYPGDYSIQIDTQPLAMANFTLTGNAACLDEWPQPPPARFQDSDYFVGGYGSTYGEELLVDGNVP